MTKARPTAGFTLMELLIALAVGLGVGGALIQVLLAHSTFVQRQARLLRQQEFAQRTRRLVDSDLRQALAVAADPGRETAACNLAGRRPVLHLRLPPPLQPITYSRGAAPSGIWGGEVLMRCGPAFGLDGSQSREGAWQNRVVLDELQAQSSLLETINRIRRTVGS